MMKLKNSLGLAVVAMILGGCSTTPQEIDSYPVHESFVVQEPLNELYYRLTTSGSDDIACNQILTSFIYPERGEFRVYYGGNLGYGNILINNAVYAKQVGPAVEIDLKKTGTGFHHKGITQRLTNYIKTGRCM